METTRTTECNLQLYKLYKPKNVSRFNGFLFIVSSSLLTIFVVLVLLESNNFPLLDELFNFVYTYKIMLLLYGLIILAIGLLLFVFNYTRTPQPIWRVKQELKFALAQINLLPTDVSLIKTVLKIFPIWKYNYKYKRVIIHFRINHVKATMENLKKLENCNAFRYSQTIELKEHTKKNGCIDGYELTIQYLPENQLFKKLLKGAKNESR